MKNKNKKVIVIIISILVVLILLLALTYAYFSTRLNGTDQIVKVGELELVLNETSEGINLGNAIGLGDSDGMSLTPSTFELRNNGNKAVDYIIYLDDNTIGDNDTRIDDKYLKYNLNKNGENSGATLLTKIGSNPNRVLDSGTIEGKTTNTYKLNLWITDEVDGNYSGQVFSGKLRVEVSQEREKEVATVLLNNIPEENQYDDGVDTFITGEDPNNYIWYSGKLWRAVSVNNDAKTVKLVTQWNISSISFDIDSSDFKESDMEEWLNDMTVDGFLYNLRDYENFIVMDSQWDATGENRELGSITRPNGTTIVTDAVGLLNLYEYQSSSGENASSYTNNYLNNILAWWTLTPYDSTHTYNISRNGELNKSLSYGSTGYGIRPSINLKSTVKIVSGNGTATNPYRLEGDNDNNLSGTLLNTRYSGEYVHFGNDNNNLYRIVSHEIGGLTKIVSYESVERMSFGSDSTFSKDNTVGTFLNENYIATYVGKKYSNLIEENSTWYIGTVYIGSSYKLAKYIDTNMSGCVDTTNVKVGLLRYGELMAGKHDNRVGYWLLTMYSGNSLIRVVDGNGLSYYQNISSNIGVRPALNLKSNVIITSGDGTKENPFEIALSN